MAVDHGGLAITWANIRREINRIAKATLQNASIGRAGLRVYGGGWISIINGGLRVVGSAIVEGLLEITGNLTGSGPFLWTGPWELRGTGKITGNVEIDGQARIKGQSTLENDLTVLPGGKVKIADMTIEQVGASGQVTFGNGGRVTASGASVTLAKGNARVEVDGTSALVTANGVSVEVSGAGIRMNRIGLPGISVPGAPPGLLYVGSGDILHITI